MNCNFVVGQKVVCVDDVVWMDNGKASNSPSGLTKGKVCTVSGVFLRDVRDTSAFKSQVCLTLVGVKASKAWVNNSGGFNSLRFRPVTERKTDISIFTAMLTEQKQPVPA